MTDHTRPAHDDEDESHEMDDLELITMAVNGHLSPERLEEVRRRLDTDPAFRELAAPVLLTWSVPSRLEREPLSIDELERDWDEFARKAGIGKHRVAPTPRDAPAATPPSRRAPWLKWLAVVVLGIAGTVAITVFAQRRASPDGAPLLSAPPDSASPATDSTATLVPYQSGWMPLMDGIDVQLSPGASLRIAHTRLALMRHVLLDGTARFRIPDIDSAVTSFRTQTLVVETRAGFVTASESEFTITARADTTVVDIHALPGHGAIPPWPMTLAPVIEIENPSQLLLLTEPGRARLIRGHDPERLSSSR